MLKLQVRLWLLLFIPILIFLKIGEINTEKYYENPFEKGIVIKKNNRENVEYIITFIKDNKEEVIKYVDYKTFKNHCIGEAITFKKRNINFLSATFAVACYLLIVFVSSFIIFMFFDFDILLDL